MAADVDLCYPVAVISDVHGNRWALEAVLRDIDGRSARQLINLGDLLTGPLDPVGTARLLLEREMLCVCGNDDRALFGPTQTLSPAQRFTLSQIDAETLEWLRALPDTVVAAQEIFACHGDLFDAPYLLEQVEASGVFLRGTPQIEASVTGIAQNIILSGHSHVPRTVALPSGRLLVNPGSVGLPAYTMETPIPYVMESGSPHARYALLHRQGGSWQVEHMQVPYDWAQAAQVARDHGRADWAAWLSSGRAQ